MDEVFRRRWGRNRQFQVEASLLALILCFLEFAKDQLHNYIFPLSVLLAKGSRLALVSLYLDSL